MTETVSDPYDESGDLLKPSEAITGIEQIAEVCERWSNPKPGKDRRIPHIANAMQTALNENDKFRQSLEFMIDFHEDPNVNSIKRTMTRDKSIPITRRVPGTIRALPFPEYAVNLSMRGLWHEWRKIKQEIGWPDKFLSHDVCLQAIQRVTDDPDLYDSFSHNIAWRPVQTTFQNRAIGPKLVTIANQARFKNPITLASIGHSLGLGEKKLLINGAFPRLRVMDWHDNMSDLLEEDMDKGRNLDLRLAPPLNFEACYAMDILPGDKDPATEAWALSSFTPDEQMNTALMDEVNRLMYVKPDNYISLRGDFAQEESKVDLIESMDGRKADIVLFSTVWYMLPKQTQKIMLSNALDILNDSGLVVLQDHVMHRDFTVEVEDPLDRLYFPHEWDSWSYRTLVLDPSSPKMDFEEALYFNNGRCGAVILSKKYRDLLF